MKEAGRSKHSGTVVKKKSSSGRLIKRRRVVESDAESSDNSSETSSQNVDDKFHKRSAVYEGAYSENREFGTEKRVSNGLDVFEFDEYDGYVYSRVRKDGRHGWNSYRKNGDQMESGSGGSRPTYSARSRLEIDDDDFDLPLSLLSKKYRSSSKKRIRLQGKNSVLKVMVNKNKQKESKPQHKKKLDKNDHGDRLSSRTEDTNRKEKGELKSNIIVETLKKPENVKKVKDKDSSDKHGSRTEKQILREKIKTMLLGAGWTIDYRPRPNKNYMDALYTNPAGTVYWSIIKAYEALQKQEEDNDEDGGILTPLPVEILGRSERQAQKKNERELKKKRENEGNRRNAKRGAMEDTVSDYEEELNSHGRKSRKLSTSTLLVRDSNKVPNSENDGLAPYSGKRTILAWLIDSGVVDMSEHVEYMNGTRTRVLQKGQVTRDGIHCGCCSKILTVLKFEQHSGSKPAGNPFPNMFLESGKSLMQCQIDAWNKLGELEKEGFYTVDVHGDDPNDDTCGVCGDGGDLICCDGCPSTFHQSCLDIEMLPEGDWLCPNCSCKYCEMAGGNCSKIGGKTEVALLTCCLCYNKYHESCRPKRDVKPHETNSLDLSFCGQECHEVYIPLQKLVGVKHELDSGFSWSLIHRSDSTTDGEVSQRVGCNSMLAVAMSVMDECFLPFTDRRSGINLIRNVVFNCGSNLSRLNYSGFYTAVLERGDEVVCAASIRFHGTQLAEMPFIGTCHIYRRQGMCRRLLSAIESALSALQVDKLIIPAVAEHLNTWTCVFGFHPLEKSHKQEMRSMNMLVFPGTDMLQKPLVKQATSDAIHKGNKTIEVDSSSALSKKPELISTNVADLGEKNGTTYSGSQESGVPMDDGFCLDASKETLSIDPTVEEESSCEPQLQLTGKESDSINSPSVSKVDKTDVQNGNGINPLPAQVHDSSHDAIPFDISLESHVQVCAAPSSEPKLQQSGQESDSTHSHSDDEIAVQNGNGTNPEEGSHGNERNRQEKERGIPGAVSDSETAANDLSINTAEVDVDDGSGLSKTELISSNVTELSDKTHVHDPSHDAIQESFSAVPVDVKSKGNNTVEVDDHSAMSRRSELISSNVAEPSDKIATTDSVSQESGAPLDDGCSLDVRKETLPTNSPPVPASANKQELVPSDWNSVDDPNGKTADAHFVLNVEESSLKVGNEILAKIIEAPSTSSEPKFQHPGKECDSIHSRSVSKVDEITEQNGNRTNHKEDSCGSEMNRKEKERGTTGAVTDSEAANDSSGLHACNNTVEVDEDNVTDKTAITDSVSQESGIPLDNGCLDATKKTLSVNSPVRDKRPCETQLQLPGKESDSISSHSGSKVDQIAEQNGNGTNPKESSCGSEMNRKENERGIPRAVSNSEAANNLAVEVDDHSAFSKKLDNVAEEFNDKTTTTDSGCQESGAPLGDGCSLDTNPPVNNNEMPVPLSANKPELVLSSSGGLDRNSPSGNIAEADSHPPQVTGVASHPPREPQLQLSVSVDAQFDSNVEGSARQVGSEITAAHSGELQLQLPGKESGCSLHATGMETLPIINPPGNDESPCEPELQLPPKESDSVQSHTDSKVDEMDVQNGHGTNPLQDQVHDPSHDATPSDIPCEASPSREPKIQQTGEESDSIHSHSDSRVHENRSGTNPLPAEVHDPSCDAIPSDIPCESHEQDPAASSSEPKPQQAGKESDSDSNVDGIDVQNGIGTPGEGVNDNIQFFEAKESSCECETNTKGKQKGVPGSEAGQHFSGCFLQCQN